MCTRYFIEKDDTVFLPIITEMKNSPLYMKFSVSMGRKIIESGEVRPTDIVPVLAPDKNGSCTAYPMRFGYSSGLNTPLLNARTETAGTKPTFREDWARHRCIIPASYYFEWQHVKDRLGNPVRTKDAVKYAIQPKGSSVTWLCGLYRIENGFPCFVILTREPVGELSGIHDRMPLIMPEGQIKKWIQPDSEPYALLQYAMTDMVFEQAQ